MGDDARSDASAVHTEDDAREPSPTHEPHAGEASPGTPPARGGMTRAAETTPAPVRRGDTREALAHEALVAVGNVLGDDFHDPFAEEIKRLRAQRQELAKQRQKAQQLLRNENRKRKRLVDKAAKMSATEMVQVLRMRSEAAKRRASSSGAASTKSA